MKALLLTEYNKLALAEIAEPLMGEGDLLIRVSACGICGSDVHGYDGSTGRRIPPIIMGHEAAGVVVRTGSAVTGFSNGDRVTFDSTVFCGSCDFCARGEVNLCDNRQVIGVSCGEFHRNGAFAELLTVPARIAYHLPNELSFAEAAMLEAVSVALHGIAVSGMRGDETVLVVGAGMIGLLLLQVARVAGLGRARVMIADIDETRLKLAADLGGEIALNATGAILTEEIMKRTGGMGVDVVFEAVGNAVTVLTAIDCVRKGGVVTLVGNVSPEVPMPLQKVVSRQIRLQGSCASSGEYPRAMELMKAGKIRVAPLISAIAPLSEGSAWFKRLHDREPNLMKVILDPRLGHPAEETGLAS